jgi:hypothetical protein
MGGEGGLFQPMAGEQKQWPLILSTQKLKHGSWQNWKLLQSSGAHGLQGSGADPCAHAGVRLRYFGCDPAT